ncbi:hypothetical protein BBJ28_00025642 [Nothophytophthora sp. Chile5]|nr:hypothetical protein BBJ28_00025642 [Nothophytophthora sp. Chile5]
MGIIEWFSLFKFSWLRRCKACGVRGSKCLCRRPSLALEHIFFLEERKNKFGARNFSHVSDTMMTSASTMFTNSTGPVGGGVVTCNNAAAGPRSSVSTSTVLMHGAGSFAESELNPTDYYYQTAVPPPPSSSSDSNGGGMTPHQTKKAAKDMQPHQHQQKKRVDSHHGHEKKQRSHSGYTRKSPKAAEFTALVRKQSGRMVKKTRFHGDTSSSRPPIKEIVTGDYVFYSEKNAPVSLPARQQTQRRSRRRSRVLANAASESKMATTQQQMGDQGVSFQFFGRGGSGRNGSAAAQVPASTSLSISSSCSTNDSLMLGSNSISSMRVSQYTDRMSLETNFSSYNPRGRLLENGYAPSIQEDAEALQTLNGWLLESPTSTQDSFMMSRCM